MTDIDRLREPPGERIAQMIKLIVHHRGPDTELALIQAFGEARIKAVYRGDEPRFSELEEIASVLGVPVSTFQFSDRGDLPELEIVMAEILYHAQTLQRRDVEKLATDLMALVPNPVEGSNILDLTRKQREQRSKH